MVNPYRGEVCLTLNGHPHTMRLTLGALVELEQTLETGSLMELLQRFENTTFSARDVVAVLVTALRGGGWEGTAIDLANADIQGGPIAATQAAAQVLARSFGAFE